MNGLDVNTTAIDVEIENDALGDMSKIVVTDNGHGMPRAHAPQHFQNLCGSWKRQRLSTPGLNRMLHCQEDRDRFKTFLLDNVVHGKVAYNKGCTPSCFGITVLKTDRAHPHFRRTARG